jgi:LysR family transcriptional regulator, glycine cleavage system transcriptional activator
MRDRIPPLPALRAFAAVAREGSFGRAAAALNVSTSAISHQLRALEAELGTALLSRARNGTARTEPTQAGLALLDAIESAFAQLGAACASVREQAKQTRPVLAISANGSIASLWLAPRLGRFAALHPSVRWQMRAIETTPDMLEAGLDLALLRARRGSAANGDRLLFQETVFPVCSPALAADLRPETLPRYSLLQEEALSSPEKTWAFWLRHFGLDAEQRASVVQFSTFNATIAAAIAGAGIALGRAPLIEQELVSGRLVRPFGAVAVPGSWDVILRRRPGAQRDAHVGQLERFLLAEAGGAG